MNPNNRIPDDGVHHSEICDIEVRLHGTSLNFKPKLKPREKEPKQNDGEAAENGDDIAENENEEAAAAGK